MAYKTQEEKELFEQLEKDFNKSKSKKILIMTLLALVGLAVLVGGAILNSGLGIVVGVVGWAIMVLGVYQFLRK